MKNKFRRFGFLCAESGTAAIEAVFVLPFIFLLYMGLQDFTALVSFNRKVTSTAAMMSDTISQYANTITRASITDIFNGVSLLMQPTSDTLVHVDIYDYTWVGTTPTLSWKVNSAGVPKCNLPDTSNLGNLMAAGNDIVISVSCFTFTPFFANVLGTGGYLLNQSIASRPRASATLKCITQAGGTTACTS